MLILDSARSQNCRAPWSAPRWLILAMVVLAVLMSLSLPGVSQAATQQKEVILSSKFTLTAQPTLEPGAPVTLKVEDVPKEITYAEVEVRVNGLVSGTKGNPVSTVNSKGVWSVTIGPFPIKSEVSLVIRVVSKLTDNQAK